jgi:hypothetical protein
MKLPAGVTFHIGGLTFREGDEIPPEHEDKLPEHIVSKRAHDVAAPKQREK